MKIIDIELSAVHVNHRGDWVFVHVLTDEGIGGIGELKAGKNYDAHKGIACLEAVRKVIGSDVDLLVDCHSRFTVKGALEVADTIRDLNMFWYEQPVPESDMAGCVKVKEECGLQIAGGEGRRLRVGIELNPEVLEAHRISV